MKKYICLLLMSMCLLSCQTKLTQGNDKVTITDLPSKAQILLKNHFNAKDVLSVVHKRTNNNFEVSLLGNRKLTFDSKGEWILIDYDKNLIPLALIPSEIRNEIAHKYGNDTHAISMHKTKDKKVEIKLSNQVTIVI